MAKRKAAVSQGKCEVCGEEFSKAAMTRHLAKCVSQREQETKPAGKQQLREVLHLVVEGRYLKEYWLHVEIAADTQFGALDEFLRHIWLECCGHLSDFRFPKEEKAKREKQIAAQATAVSRSGGLAAWFEQSFVDFLDDFSPEAIDRANQQLMGSKIGSRVAVGDVFQHEYDFGSTTELTLKVVGKPEGKLRLGDVRLLARNLPPEIRCPCGQLAKWVCQQCSYDAGGWLCNACGKKHECGDEMFLPVVNSPRVGVCGYGGPEE